MTHSKNKWLLTFMIFLVFIFSFPTFMRANAEYKIISCKGTVKVKKDNEVKPPGIQLPINLKKDDAVMVYPGAVIEMVFTDGNKKTFTGPFYSTVELLEKPFDREPLSFFGKPDQWKSIERIFDEEGEESAGTTKGTQEDSLNFYNEINQGVAEVKTENKTLTPTEEKEMRKILDTAEQGFNASGGQKPFREKVSGLPKAFY